jgi:hypothetical protein
MLTRPDAWECIVVDNNSGDGSIEMVRNEFSATRVLENKENLGFAKANNQAFGVCRGRYVLLLNPDTVVLDHAIDCMVETMERRPDVAALGCGLLNTDGSFQRWNGGHPPNLRNVTCHFLFAYRVLPARVLPPPLYLEKKPEGDSALGWVSGTCMLLRREALGNQIFDERFFMYGEDIDLCQRLSRTGWSVLYTPRAQIVHHDGASLASQSPDFEVNKLRGLRDVFAVSNGPVAMMLYDLVVSAGFLLRALAYGIAALTHPGRGFDTRAGRSRLFLSEAVRTLVHR